MRWLLTTLILIQTTGLVAQRTPDPGDLLLSELLFDPVGDGEDFVEVYNASPDSLRLDGVQVVNARGTTRALTTDFLLPPGEYLVLTDDPQDIELRYPSAVPDRMLAIDLPALPNETGRIEILSATGERLDAFTYHADMHAELLDSEGVSLERRSFTVAAAAVDNWSSASSASGYGTPTRSNSQQRAGVVSEPEVQLAETVFYPATTGQSSVASVTYRTGRPGYFAQLAVFDSGGRPIISRPRTELLSTAGTLIWDGRDTNGTLQLAGPYVLLVRLFHPDGRTATFKLVAILAS